MHTCTEKQGMRKDMVNGNKIKASDHQAFVTRVGMEIAGGRGLNG